MESQNIKQWIRDYLDFAMPLIMVVVVWNVADSIIVGITSSSDGYYNAKFSDFFTISEHLMIFMNSAESGRLFVYSLIVLGSALFLRLFTNKIKVNLYYCSYIILIYVIVNEMSNSHFANGKTSVLMTIFTIIDGIVFVSVSVALFTTLKIFFANFNMLSKRVAYILIFIISVFVLINKLEIMKLSLEINQIIFGFLICIVIVAALYDGLRSNNPKTIIPQDVKEYRKYIQLEYKKTMSDLQDTMDSIKEKRNIKNTIKDLVDYAKKM